MIEGRDDVEIRTLWKGGMIQEEGIIERRDDVARRTLMKTGMMQKGG